MKPFRLPQMHPYTEVIVAACLFGTSGVFIKWLNMQPGEIAFYRMAIPALVLFAIVKVTAPQTPLFREGYRILLIASVLNAVRMFCYFAAFTYTSTGNAVVILYSWPVFVAIVGKFALNEQLTREKILLLLLSFCGILVVFSGHEFSFRDDDFKGMAYMLLSAVVYAGTVILFKKYGAGYGKYEITFFQNVAGGFLFFPVLLWIGHVPAVQDALVCTVFVLSNGVVAFSLFFSALRKVDASVASIFSYLEVPSTIILGMIFNDEQITLSLFAGGLLILLPTLYMRLKYGVRTVRNT